MSCLVTTSFSRTFRHPFLGALLRCPIFLQVREEDGDLLCLYVSDGAQKGVTIVSL